MGCTKNDGFESCSEQFLNFRQGSQGKMWSRTFKDINAAFKKAKPIEAETFQAKIAKSSNSGDLLELMIPGGKPREFLLLALADLSLQRGFKFLVELKGMKWGKTSYQI